MKNCSISLKKKMDLKKWSLVYNVNTNLRKFKRWIISTDGKDVRENVLYHTLGQNIKWNGHFGG